VPSALDEANGLYGQRQRAQRRPAGRRYALLDLSRAVFRCPLIAGRQGLSSSPKGEVVTGIRVVNAYGHSPGMLAYRGNARLLVWADVANQYVVSIQQPEWGTGFDDEKDAAIATRKRVLDMVATDRLPVAGFHMPFPSLGWVEKSGTGYRWVPATYRFNL
jgi:glyoxylase-like metal-dependent hydrolase (beta-lactamase superfamily II)